MKISSPRPLRLLLRLWPPRLRGAGAIMVILATDIIFRSGAGKVLSSFLLASHCVVILGSYYLSWTRIWSHQILLDIIVGLYAFSQRFLNYVLFLGEAAEEEKPLWSHWAISEASGQRCGQWNVMCVCFGKLGFCIVQEAVSCVFSMFSGHDYLFR